MTYEFIFALAAFAFVSSITPGPNNLMLMSSGMNFGVVRSLPHMAGVTLGFVLMILLVGLGLAGIFELFPQSYTLLKIVSVAYLLYLAWKIANAAAPSASERNTARPMTFIQAALFQWVNPKAWTMALTACGSYTLTSQPYLSLAVVALVFGLVNLPSIAFWMMAGTQLRRFLDDPVNLRRFNVICAVLLVASLYPIVFGEHGLG